MNNIYIIRNNWNSFLREKRCIILILILQEFKIKFPSNSFQNGTLKIIDRKKHIFKLSQGEYIVPEKIENIYIRSQYVQQVFVHGESLKSCIIAIVVPDVDVVKCWAVENGIPGTLSVLCANPEVKKLIMDDMLTWGKEAGLKSFEQVNYRFLFSSVFFLLFGRFKERSFLIVFCFIIPGRLYILLKIRIYILDYIYYISYIRLHILLKIRIKVRIV